MLNVHNNRKICFVVYLEVKGRREREPVMWNSFKTLFHASDLALHTAC